MYSISKEVAVYLTTEIVESQRGLGWKGPVKVI